MRELDHILLPQTKETGEFPLPVAEDWDELVQKSQKLCDLIDKHLDFESKLQGRELRPMTLCPEQKVSLISDLAAV